MNRSSTVDELRRLRAGAVPHALVDVRGLREAEAGHIRGASVVPLGSLDLRIDAMVPDRGLPVVVYDGGEERGGGPVLEPSACADRLRPRVRGKWGGRAGHRR